VCEQLNLTSDWSEICGK